MLAAVIAEAIAIALLAVLVIGLLRSHALILKSLHELGAGLELEAAASTSTNAGVSPVGPIASARPTGANPTGTEVELEPGVMPSSRAEDPHPHDVIGTTLAGREVHVPVTEPGERTLLAFLSSGCSVCKTFWEEFRSGDTQVPGDARLAIITQGPDTESPSALGTLAGDLEIVQSSAAWSDYDIPGSPYFVFVEDGRITGEGSSTTWAQVRDLMAQAVDDAQIRGAGATHEEIGRGARDDMSRIDQELSAAGLTKDDPSFYLPPDFGDDALAADAQAHHHDHAHQHSH